MTEPLCTTGDAEVLANAYGSIAAGQPAGPRVKEFGRYLFEVLLGKAVWAKILEQADASGVELGLSWSTSEWALSRLPWEMMHDGTEFLAARHKPLVAVHRVVQPLKTCPDPPL